jgi:hypothetical protein
MSWESPSIFTSQIRRGALPHEGLSTAAHDHIFEALLGAARMAVSGTTMELVVYGQGNQFRVTLGDHYVNVKQCEQSGGLLLAIRTHDEAIVTDPGPVWERDVTRWAESLARYIVHFLAPGA